MHHFGWNIGRKFSFRVRHLLFFSFFEVEASISRRMSWLKFEVSSAKEERYGPFSPKPTVVQDGVARHLIWKPEK